MTTIIIDRFNEKPASFGRAIRENMGRALWIAAGAGAIAALGLSLDVLRSPAPAPVAETVTHSVECPTKGAGPRLDCSGASRTGVASFYASRFGGRTMADGTPMSLHGNNAASRTLPLGTIARVTNLETGKSALIKIRDRGPYVDGRIIDLSPGTAQKIGIARKQGVAKVKIAPIVVPLPDGTNKHVAGSEV